MNQPIRQPFELVRTAQVYQQAARYALLTTQANARMAQQVRTRP
jgi:hypothetical protein